LVVSSTTRGIRRKISAPEDYHIPSYINYDNRYDKYGKGEAYGKYK
jgi:hypothetical protein